MYEHKLIIKPNRKRAFFLLVPLIGILYEPLQFISNTYYSYIVLSLSIIAFLIFVISFKFEFTLSKVFFFIVPIVIISYGLLKEEFITDSIARIILYSLCLLLFFHRDGIDERSSMLIIRTYIVFYFLIVFSAVLQVAAPSLYKSVIISGYNQYNQTQMELFVNNGILIGLFNNPGKLAGYSVFAFAFAVFVPRATRNNALRLFVIVSSLLCIYMTGKRAFALFGVVTLLIIKVRYAPVGKRLLAFFKSLGITVVSFFALSIVVRLITNQSLFEVFSQFFRLDSGDITTSRTFYWDIALGVFKENVTVGVGWAQFKSIVGSFGMLSNHVHNIFLQLLCETGIIGAVVFYTMFLIPLITTAKRLKSVYILQKNTSDDMSIPKGIILSSLYLQVFFLLYGITGNPLYDVMFFVPYAIACAMGCRSIVRSGNVES